MNQLSETVRQQGRNPLRWNERMAIAYVLLIMLAANQFFDVGWWWHVVGVFNVADVGNALVWLGLFVVVLRGNSRRMFTNPIAKLIPFYLFFVLLQPGLAWIYYGQPVFMGLIGTRYQFYFAAFLLFWALLDTPEKLRATLNGITVLAAVGVILGVINYFGPKILSQTWASGSVRSGIVRAFLPGMPLISAAAIWTSSKWTEDPLARSRGALPVLFFLAAHVFRQSRMRMFGVMGVIALQLLYKRRVKLLAMAAIAAGAGIAVMVATLPENIITTQFQQATASLEQGSGTWRGRAFQLKVDFQEFWAHPILGSGSSALRVTIDPTSYVDPKTLKLWEIAYKDDLGYTHWLKSYGLVGVVWLLLFFGALWRGARKSLRSNSKENRDLSNFGMSFLIFIVGTFVTLNHMMFPYGITLVCLLAAIIVRLNEQPVLMPADEALPVKAVVVGQPAKSPSILRPARAGNGGRRAQA